MNTRQSLFAHSLAQRQIPSFWNDFDTHRLSRRFSEGREHQKTDLLEELKRRESPVALSDIADFLGVSVAKVSYLAHGFIDSGLIVRTAHRGKVSIQFSGSQEC